RLIAAWSKGNRSLHVRRRCVVIECVSLISPRSEGLSSPRFFERHGCELTLGVLTDENVMGSWNRLRDGLSIGNIRPSGDRLRRSRVERRDSIVRPTVDMR